MTVASSWRHMATGLNSSTAVCIPPVAGRFLENCRFNFIFFILAGYGNFTFKMDFYDSPSFSTAYTQRDYPLEMPLDDYVYLGYSVESSADLVIMAANCKATKDGSFYSWPQYTFMENG